MRRFVVWVLATSLLWVLTTPVQAQPEIVLGLWPQSYAQFLEIEAASGVALPYFRSRQRAGQFDANLVESDGAAAAAAGYSLGLNIQPKTGSGPDRTGILYTDITAQLRAGAGPLYDKLVAFANEVLGLPSYGEVTHYLQFHSEANIQAPPGELDAQPYSGTAQEYQECYQLVHALFDSMGVTDRIEWQVVLSRSAFEGNQGGPTAWFPADTSLYDLVGVDSYRRAPSWLTPSASFDSALTFARSVGKPIWIDETASDEGSAENSATAKAEWFAAMGTYIEEHRSDIAGIVFSNAADGGNWFLDSVLTGGRASPNYTGTTWEGWEALAQRLTTLPPIVHTLSVARAGEGSGTVTSDPPGIDCGAVCSAPVDDGSQATLRAVAEPGSVFEGWSGAGVACAGTGPCTVTVTGDTIVVATFRLAPKILFVSLDGTGAGTVMSSPGGIDCGTVCSAAFPHADVVTLTATPAAGSVFSGWSGACAGTGDCAVTMDADRTASAVFDALPPPVELPDADAAVAYGGWRGTVDPAASGGGYRVSSVKNERATWAAPSVATSISWIARTGPDRGMASVTIDGSNKGTVDLYAASPGSVSIAYPGLRSARHTVVVKVLGTKRAASSGTSVTIDAFVAGSVVADDRDPRIRYGPWSSTAQAAATDGTYRSTAAKDAIATVAFSGTSIDWVTARGPGQGKASVTIDGVSKGIVDLYAPSTAFRAVVPYADLDPGTHTMVIKVLGTKNAAANGTRIVIDGFVVYA
jgi:hypothetical protein